jgi:hypothetical protein
MPDVYVSATGSDADFVLKLIDAYPDPSSDEPANPRHIIVNGSQMLVLNSCGKGFKSKPQNQYDMLFSDSLLPTHFSKPIIGNINEPATKETIKSRKSSDAVPNTFCKKGV